MYLNGSPLIRQPTVSKSADAFSQFCWRCRAVTLWRYIANVAGQQIYECQACHHQQMYRVTQ